MTRPRRPRSPEGVRAEGDPVRSYRLDHRNYQALERKALAEPDPRTMSDITRALIEGWTEGEITLTVRVRSPRRAGAIPNPVRSYRCPEPEWQAFTARCTEAGYTRTSAVLSLLVMWHRGEITVQWLGDRVEVSA